MTLLVTNCVTHSGANKGLYYYIHMQMIKEYAVKFGMSIYCILVHPHHFLPFSLSNRLVRSSKSRSPSPPPELPPLGSGMLPVGTAGKLKPVGQERRQSRRHGQARTVLAIAIHINVSVPACSKEEVTKPKSDS